MLDFTDEEIKNLQKCFDSLDGDNSKCIGVDELENPLIGLGFASNREEINEMIKQVDVDGSGQIEFDEFLLIIKNNRHKTKGGNEGIAQFFKDLTSGNLDDKGNKNLSFGMLVQNIKRSSLMDAIVEKKYSPRWRDGQKILQNIRIL